MVSVTEPVYETSMTFDGLISNADIAAAKADWAAAQGTPNADQFHRFYVSLVTGQAWQVAAEFRLAHRAPAVEQPGEQD